MHGVLSTVYSTTLFSWVVADSSHRLACESRILVGVDNPAKFQDGTGLYNTLQAPVHRPEVLWVVLGAMYQNLSPLRPSMAELRPPSRE